MKQMLMKQMLMEQMLVRQIGQARQMSKSVEGQILLKCSVVYRSEAMGHSALRQSHSRANIRSS
jgi:hypothetical protein